MLLMSYDVVVAIVAKVARREDVYGGAAKQEGKTAITIEKTESAKTLGCFWQVLSSHIRRRPTASRAVGGGGNV